MLPQILRAFVCRVSSVYVLIIPSMSGTNLMGELSSLIKYYKEFVRKIA